MTTPQLITIPIAQEALVFDEQYAAQGVRWGGKILVIGDNVNMADVQTWPGQANLPDALYQLRKINTFWPPTVTVIDVVTHSLEFHLVETSE